MWVTIFIILFAAGISLYSMQNYLDEAKRLREEKEQEQLLLQRQQKSYVLLDKNQLDVILRVGYQYLLEDKTRSGSITFEIVKLSTTEIVVTISNELYERISPQILSPINDIWQQLEPYKKQFMVKDSSEGNVAGQIIMKVKKENIVILSVKSVDFINQNYVYSGIDDYKWRELQERNMSNKSILTTLHHVEQTIKEYLYSNPA